ncbi:MAG TPA: prolipoprotein diacylglyceryl transferase [Abditibacteriaceae bacterium]
MRPELAVIPQLPTTWLWPLLIAVWVLTLGIIFIPYFKTRRFDNEAALAPLVFGAVLCGLVVVLSRTSITLHSYGFFLILGFGLATLNACLEAKRRGYDPNLVLDLMLPMLLVTVICCRIVYVLLNREQFQSFGKMLEVWQGGLSFHGIFPGSIAVVGYFAYTRKMRFGVLADLLAPSVFLGYFFGRLGCFFNGCCYGHACDLPWAMQFPTEENRALITPPSHPTQLYSAVLAVGLFVFMQRAKLSPKWTQFPGQLTLLFFGLYAVERFFIEFFRAGATARYLFGSPLTEAQWTSIFGLMAIAVFWIGLARREAKAKAQISRLPSVESATAEPTAASVIEA